MRLTLSLTLVAVSALALAGCGETSEPDGVNTEAANALPDAEATAGEPVTDAREDMAQTIPAALQGDWAMTEGDCFPENGAAKGRIEISDTQMRFYESVGTLSQVQERDAEKLVATFDFTGEGMEWTRTETLSLDGAVMTRSTDQGDAQGPYEYSRCG